MNDGDQTGLGWTVVLRRQPVRIVDGRAEVGYTDVYELVCCDCGDYPGLDYREVPAELQRVRGPYHFVEGIAAYQRHVQRYHGQRANHQPAARRDRSAVHPLG
jgi:hypothetical protein